MVKIVRETRPESPAHFALNDDINEIRFICTRQTSNGKNRKGKKAQTRKPLKAPRKLTDRRVALIQEFLKKSPKSSIGSDAWIKGLIQYMREPPHWSVAISDVKFWLQDSPEVFQNRPTLKEPSPSSSSTSYQSEDSSLTAESASDSTSDSDMGEDGNDAGESGESTLVEVSFKSKTTINVSGQKETLPVEKSLAIANMKMEVDSDNSLEGGVSGETAEPIPPPVTPTPQNMQLCLIEAPADQNPEYIYSSGPCGIQFVHPEAHPAPFSRLVDVTPCEPMDAMLTINGTLAAAYCGADRPDVFQKACVTDLLRLNTASALTLARLQASDPTNAEINCLINVHNMTSSYLKTLVDAVLR